MGDIKLISEENPFASNPNVKMNGNYFVFECDGKTFQSFISGISDYEEAKEKAFNSARQFFNNG
jgi:hypothetical protein